MGPFIICPEEFCPPCWAAHAISKLENHKNIENLEEIYTSCPKCKSWWSIKEDSNVFLL